MSKNRRAKKIYGKERGDGFGTKKGSYIPKDITSNIRLTITDYYLLTVRRLLSSIMRKGMYIALLITAPFLKASAGTAWN